MSSNSNSINSTFEQEYMLWNPIILIQTVPLRKKNNCVCTIPFKFFIFILIYNLINNILGIGYLLMLILFKTNKCANL